MGNNENRPPATDRLKKKQAATAKVILSMSDDVGAELEESENAFAMAQMNAMNNPEDTSLVAKLDQAKQALAEARDSAVADGVEFVFRSIGRKAYDRLVNEHPPSNKAKNEAEKQGEDPKNLQWDPYTFPQALVAAAIIHPKLDLDSVEEIWESDDWNGNELQALFYTALSVQQKTRVVQLGNV